MGDEINDVVIVGAGPAGASAAIRLAQKRLRVTLVEQKHFPRPKLCGEFISPECKTHFAELGVGDEIADAAVVLNRTVFYARNGPSVGVASEWFGDGSYALGLSRSEMDARLLNRARAVGVEVIEGAHAAGLLFDRQKKVAGVDLRAENGDAFGMAARLTIDATGRSRVLARQIEKASGRGVRTAARFVAFKTHLAGAAIAPDICEIYTYKNGYGGCSRVERDLYNLCFIVSAEVAKKYGGDAAQIMQKVVFANARAKRSLQNIEFVGDWLAVPIEAYGRSALAPAEGLIAIGDAAAFIDPFTGSGILLALESARIAAGVISDEFERPERSRSFTAMVGEYNTKYSAAFDKRLRVCRVLRHAAFMPFLAETVIKTLALSERLTRRLAKATRPVRRSAA